MRIGNIEALQFQGQLFENGPEWIQNADLRLTPYDYGLLGQETLNFGEWIVYEEGRVFRVHEADFEEKYGEVIENEEIGLTNRKFAVY